MLSAASVSAMDTMLDLNCWMSCGADTSVDFDSEQFEDLHWPACSVQPGRPGSIIYMYVIATRKVSTPSRHSL